MSVIEVTKYYPAVNVDYRNNSLIELFSHVSKDFISRLLFTDVECTDEDKRQDAEIRLQYVHRLLNYFSPLPDQVDFAFNFWTTICNSYTQRNPAKRDTQRAFIEMVESMHNNTFFNNGQNIGLKYPNCLTFIGTPGTGKSQVAQRLLSGLSLDCVFHHTRDVNCFQKLYIWVEAPNARHEKSLAWLVYEALHQAVLDTGIKYPKINARLSAPVIAQEAAVLARKLNVGVVVVDEIQHCVHLKNGLDAHSMEFLTGFINRVNCPVLLIGTWKASALLSSEFRLARRAISPASTFSRKLPPGETWNMFTQEIWEKQFTTHHTPWSETIASELYFHSQGVQDIAIKLFVIAQMEAISSGEEVVGVEQLRSAAETHLQFIGPSIQAMRDGTNESDETLWDVEPVDFEEYLLKLQVNCETQLGKAARRAASARASKANKSRQVSGALSSLGLASEENADVIAQVAVDRTPTKSASTLAISEIQRLTRQGPKPTKSTKKMALRDTEFDALPSGDIRKIVYQANRAGRNPHDDLFGIGYISPIADLLYP